MFSTPLSRTFSRLIRCQLTLWALLLLCLPATAQTAGTSITNRANVTYQDGVNQVSLDSNEVLVTVQPVESLVMAPDNTLRVAPGDTVALPHRLVNTGNVDTSVTLRVENLTGDDYDLSGLQIGRDLNGNGRLDAGEPVLSSQPLALAQGQVIDLVVVGTVATSAPNGKTARLRLTATGAAQNVAVTNTDTIQTAGNLALQLTKSATALSAAPGDEVTFTLAAANVGDMAPNGLPIIIDGAAFNAILVRDALPVNTTFVSIAAPGNGRLLYHLAGEALHTYTSVIPSQLERVDAAAVAFASLPAPANVSITLKLRVNANASGDLFNFGRLYYADPTSGDASEVRSNTVQVRVPTVPPSIRYYTSAAYIQPAEVTEIGHDLHIQVVAANCNLDASTIEQVTLHIKSSLTGDEETRTATETGPNTGIFRIDTPLATDDGRQHQATNGDNVMATMPRDTLMTWADCHGIRVQDDILVDPFGVIFDSKTNAPIAGTRVTLIDVTGQGNGGNAGGPARVLDIDGVTVAPSTVTTGADGEYMFPLVASSTYRLQIEPPVNYAFPSVVPAASLPSGRIVDPSSSFGGNFIVNAELGAVQVDVPLDPAATGDGLFVEKTAGRRSVEIGDMLDYTVKVRNTSGGAVTNIVLTDLLPAGFAFESGSARLSNGLKLRPTTGNSPRLSFDLGTLAAGADVTLSYRVRISVNAQTGETKNLARGQGVSGATTFTSNMASAQVRVTGGIFDSKGILIGHVFVDRNGNRVQDKGEPGIPGVRLYLEDGTFVITDSAGMYDVYGLSATTHVVKVDTTTLPAGSRLVPLTVAHAGKGDSSFVDLKIGELHKVNFAEGTATPEILQEIERRRAQIAKFGEIDLAVGRTLSSNIPQINAADTRALPATGIVNTPQSSGVGAGALLQSGVSATGKARQLKPRNVPPTAQAESTNQTGLPTLNAGNSNLPPEPVAPAPQVGATERSLPADLTNKLGFVDFKDGDTLPTDQANIRVKGGAGSTLTLKVNGETVDASRVGSKSKLESAQAEVWEFIGVRLKAGANSLEVSEVDSFGITRGTSRLSLVAPGRAGKIEVRVPAAGQPADARTPVEVQVRLTDDKGVLVSARVPLTLESTRGRWLADDLNPTEPGTQVFLEKGEASFKLLAPSEPGDALVRITSGLLGSAAKIAFLPELRPILAAGVVDTKLNLFGFKPSGARQIATSQFEQELRGLSAGGNDAVTGRAAMFLKGQVQGKYLLTLRYDSQGEKDERLFRDIQPDEYYPVDGDDALKGFDAQSTSRLYVRVDKDKSYMMLGDYTTSTPNEARSLGEYNRSFNGVRAHSETNKLSANVWATRDNSTQLIDELRGRGTSGPYPLRATNLVEQSEKVEIIVRDRNQPSVVLSTTPQTRFQDYQFDARTGGILFRSPVPSVDENLNPVYVRVTYEVNQDGPKFNVAGVDAQYKLSKNLEVGGAMVRDSNPQNHLDLRTLNATYRINSDTTLIGEWAQNNTDDTGSGDAKRIELLHQSNKLTARAFIGQSDPNFNNPASVLSQGRKEASFKATYQLDGQNVVRAEALRTQDAQTGGKREGGQLSVEHTFPNNVRLEVALRHAKESTTPAQPTSAGTTPTDFTSARVKVTVPVPGQPKANVFGEYEQALGDSSQKVAAIGGDYQISNRSRIYARHELVSSLSGRYALNDVQDQHATVIDTDVAHSSHVFSEYRINNGISGREAEAAIGLRNGWDVAPGVRVNTTFERTKSMGGATGNDSTAATAAVEYTARPDLKATLRLECRSSGTGGRTLLATAGAAYKMNQDWTFLTKTVLNSGSGQFSDGLYDRLLLGWAYRQARTDRWNALAKYEWRRGRPGDATGSNADGPVDSARILSVDVNYQPGRDWQLSGHYAAKWSRTKSDGLGSSYLAQMISARLTGQLSRRAELSVMGSLASGDSSHRLGLGIEYDHLLRDNLWLGIGYNLADTNDADLFGDEAFGRGVYLRLRWKFDENLFTKANVADVLPAAPVAPAK